MILPGWISAAHCLYFTGMTVRRATMSGVLAWESAVGCVSLLSNIKPLEFYFWTSQRNASVPVLPRLLKRWKTPVLANLVTLFHKYPKRSLQKPKSVCLPWVARRTRAKMGSFTLSAAFEQPRVGMTDDLVNLLWHFIGNRMISYFSKCDVNCRKYYRKLD